MTAGVVFGTFGGGGITSVHPAGSVPPRLPARMSWHLRRIEVCATRKALSAGRFLDQSTNHSSISSICFTKWYYRESSGDFSVVVFVSVCMKIAFYSAKEYDRELFGDSAGEHEILFLKDRLGVETAKLATGFEVVCVFVNDELDRPVLELLHAAGIRFVALRCAGFNNVDIVAAAELGIKVARVPSYSPNAVAEHAVAMLLTLNRKTHRAYNRVREGNFELNGLMGFDLVGKTVGVFGSGKIGLAFCRIMKGFGCEVIVCDPYPSDEAKQYELVTKEELFSRADIVSLHCPLLEETHHLYCEDTFALSKRGFTLINTGRGGLVHAKAAIGALKSGQLGYLAMDVYEEEKDYFFDDQSSGIIQDDVLMRLMTFPNVLITGHQGFFTQEALQGIVQTTMTNITAYAAGIDLVNEVK